MEKLYQGVQTFQKAHFRREKEFFRQLSRQQSPDALFITCADSRIDPNLVTQSRPGDLFIVRNVGNIIPPHGSIQDKNSVAAAIEFAVLGLQVADIIVCGHSGCGAMRTLLENDGGLEETPHLRDWLQVAAPVKVRIMLRCTASTAAHRLRLLEQENVLEQIENLRSYPFVNAAVLEGRLRVHGWYYDIAGGTVSFYEPEAARFERIA